MAPTHRATPSARRWRAALVLALLLQPGFAALGLPPLTMPFILACWLIQAGRERWRQAVADNAPSANP